MTRYLVLFGLFAGLLPVTAAAQPVDDTSLDEELPPAPGTEIEVEMTASDRELFGVGEEFELDERDRVISAARTETTIQEVPAIVSVITREEIEARGFRTILEVLQTIPGFEGDRSDGNHWIEETFARGNPRTVLVLINGINVVEPTRNMLVLDRKIPLEIVERIEITSGPGGVLWGSNALLGVINITLRNGRDQPGWRVRFGGGSGPGDLEAGEFNLAFGEEIGDDVYLFANLNLFSSRGAEVTVDSQKVVGVLPLPQPDGASFFLSEPITTINSRDFFGSFYLDLRGGPVTFNAFVQLEQDHRPQAFGGAVLTTDLRSPEVAAAIGPIEAENAGQDALWLFSLNYRDRFSEDDVGFSATGYLVRWLVNEDPFGSFPPSDLLPRGVVSRMFTEGQYRTGLNLDADVVLPANNHLIFGGEAFADLTDGIFQEFQDDPGDPDNIDTVTAAIINPADRYVSSVYVSDEWRASDVVALNAGTRLQMSDTYDPAVLASSALVWNMFDDTYLKLNYSEGLRPPELLATHVNSDIPSGLTFVGNPDLNVERSRAAEAEINAVVVEDTDPVDRWFVRADYSFTVIDDLIQNTSTGFANAGTRFIHSVEFLSRIDFEGDHELSTAYYFVDAADGDTGPLRNIANHIANVHGQVQLVPNLLHISADVTWVGPREDINREVREPDEPGQLVLVIPSDVVIEELEPVTLLRAGIYVNDIADTFDIGVFGHNILDQEYAVPDEFFDDRVMTRPLFMPRWSVFAMIEAEF
jgi:iron complex outermembrane receptor protein